MSSGSEDGGSGGSGGMVSLLAGTLKSGVDIGGSVV